MSVIRFALNKPYTVIAMVILVCLLGALAVVRMPVDIFPEINIPVVSVVWTYSGMAADEIQNRILIKHERQMASLVDDISRMEATSYNGVGVIKVYLHEGADVSRAVSQLTSSAQTVLKSMPRNITPPLILRYGATDVPIIQLSLSSASIPDQRMTDFGQQVLRPALAVVRGASVPYPYGGKPRVMMVDLNMQALQARGLSPADVTNALTSENLVAPSGDVKIGQDDYAVRMNNSTETVAAIDDFPIKIIGHAPVFLRDVAHIRDGYSVQTNSVSVNGRPGCLVTIRKTGGVSTLGVIAGVRKTVAEDIQAILPKGMTIKAIFDQSIFVKASLDSVLIGGAMAAALTALMILLFLGNWRLTIIILASIPLSIVTAVLVMYCMGQTLNTMTLGGFALAVGILVDNATVVIENIERRLHLGAQLEEGIEQGALEIAKPTVVSTLAICIVFIPVFLLQGTAKYLFSPLSLSVIVALLASLVLSFTLVPVLFKYLMRGMVVSHHLEADVALFIEERKTHNPFMWVHHKFNNGFDIFRDRYRNTLAWSVSRPMVTVGFFAIVLVGSIFLFPRLGMDFFPQVDAGQMRLHVRAPPGTRLEETQADFASVESAIRNIVGNNQIDTMLDNIGLPYSGINIALSDTSTVGPMDGEILISLKEKHTPTAGHVADLRRDLPGRFPGMQFFFQPADIVNQVLNFGQPSPIDIRVSGPHRDVDWATANKVLADLRRVPGIVDAHIYQVPKAPSMNVDVDRALAETMGMSQRDVANSVLVTLSSSAMMAPNFWLNPRNNVSYPLLIQAPQYRVDSLPDVMTMPITGGSAVNGKHPETLLMDVAHVQRGEVPMVLTQFNIRPVFDVQADVQGTDLGSVASAIDTVISNNQPPASDAVHIGVAGQVQTMRESFSGLAGGMVLAVALVYLLLAINFQSWTDPMIVLMAVPFSLAGVMWMLFITHTHISVPALMGTLMCIGLTTANSTLVVAFANDRLDAGDDSLAAAIASGFTRLRPVLMTAGAMVLGMVPMALGVGEGGEQNAPLARAVIGGLIFATVATLVFVPAMYSVLRRRRAPSEVAATFPMLHGATPA